MNVNPILHLGLRLGEGTGAICAYPIVDSSVRMINEMNPSDRSSAALGEMFLQLTVSPSTAFTTTMRPVSL